MSGPNSSYDPVEVTPLKADEVEGARDAAAVAVRPGHDPQPSESVGLSNVLVGFSNLTVVRSRA